MRYGAGIIDWTKDELRQIDRKTRKLLTIHRALQPQADVDRLYMARADGGRGLIRVEVCIALEVTSLVKYINKSMEATLKAVLRENILSIEKATVDKTMMNEERKRKLVDKPLHGQFFRSTQDRDEKSWDWVEKGKLKKETEGLLMAAQDQALRTNSNKCRIDKQKVLPSCRMCGEREETVVHVTGKCKTLAQKYYKNWRHHKVAQIIIGDFVRNWVLRKTRNGIAICLSLSLSWKIVRSYGTLKSKPIYQSRPTSQMLLYLRKS